MKQRHSKQVSLFEEPVLQKVTEIGEKVNWLISMDDSVIDEGRGKELLKVAIKESLDDLVWTEYFTRLKITQLQEANQEAGEYDKSTFQRNKQILELMRKLTIIHDEKQIVKQRLNDCNDD